MINKNIKKIFDPKSLAKIQNLDLNLRPSDIDPGLYYKLAKILKNRG